MLAYLDHIQADGLALRNAAAAQPDADVWTCPGWRMVDLVAHTGRVHRWVTEILTTQAAERIRYTKPIPDTIDAALAWFDEGLTGLVSALRQAGTDTLVWNWADNKPAPSGFWWRRMAQETVIHRCDAELAGGMAPTPIDHALATDGIDEFLWICARPDEDATPDPSISGEITLTTSDTGARWDMRLGSTNIDLIAEAHGDQVEASASELYLWLLHRGGKVSVLGPGDAAAAWERVKFE